MHFPAQMTQAQIFYFMGPPGAEAFLRMPDGTCHFMPAIAEFNACPITPTARCDAKQAPSSLCSWSQAPSSPAVCQPQATSCASACLQPLGVERGTKRARQESCRAPSASESPTRTTPAAPVSPLKREDGTRRSPPQWIKRLPTASAIAVDTVIAVQRPASFVESTVAIRPSAEATAGATIRPVAEPTSPALLPACRRSRAKYNAAYWSAVETQPLSQGSDGGWNVTTQDYERLEALFPSQSNVSLNEHHCR